MASQPRDQQTAARGGGSRPFAFVRGVIDELRKVVWPTPQELYRYTVVVVVTVLIIALFIGGTDLLVGGAATKFIYQASPKP